MTLTLDDVRNMKFRMARRAGYEVIDVDQFVDQVEEAFAQLGEENAQLKKQIETLQAAAQAQGADESRPAYGQPSSESQFAAPSAVAAPSSAASAPSSAASATETPTAAGAPTSGPGAAAAAAAAVGAETIVVTTREEASPAVVKMVQIHTEIAERLVTEARDESDGIVADARRQAHEITTDARTKAERVESEARVNAERLRSDAQDRATAQDQELSQRRVQAMSALEAERDTLTGSVQQLRTWEKKYRGSLTEHLKSQLTQLESGHFEPEGAPRLLDESSAAQAGGQQSGSRAAETQSQPQQPSATPRLDALLGEDKN